jgi:high-affinity nickel-transport protein
MLHPEVGMDNDFASLSDLFLMFVLGLRHGLDPDHIAMIDSMIYRSLEQRRGITPWIGTLFALGHGLTVTVIAVGLSAFVMQRAIPVALANFLAWLPVALLLWVGTLNLRALFRTKPYQAMGWKTRFFPRRLRQNTHPFAVFSIGVLFALVFDTATQAAAWGYVATKQAGIHMALFVGLSFTLGMTITDTLDGRLMYRFLQRASKQSAVQIYRRNVGWIVVVLAYSMAAYSIASHWLPSFRLSDLMLTYIGVAMFLALLIGYAWVARNFSRHAHQLN